jgi:hypothetical protein
MLLLATHLDQVVEQKQLLPYPPSFTIPFFFQKLYPLTDCIPQLYSPFNALFKKRKVHLIPSKVPYTVFIVYDENVSLFFQFYQHPIV